MKKHIFIWSFLIALFVFVSSQKSSKITNEGHIQVDGGQIWYKIMGSGNQTPLLVIHGGPGSRCCEYIDYLAPLSQKRPIILYDQLGSGKSDRPADTTLWNLSHFVNEVSVLRKTLNIEKFHIIGHSWGASIAIEYILTKTDNGVKSLILAGPLISTKQWINDANILRSSLPEDVQEALNIGEDSHNYDSPEYLAATDSFYAKFLTRKGWPYTPPSSCEGSGEFNTDIYEYMWGPSEFLATGTLSNFDRTDRLKEIDMPVLFIVGQYDEARPETMIKYQQLIPGSFLKIIEEAGHESMRDQPAAFNQTVTEFLNSIE